jgi:vacuolar-type H+-ATPase catalytic subunit A/Vma1
LLFERALQERTPDIQLYLHYADFCAKSLKDMSAARALYERARTNLASFPNLKASIQLALENALFEEENQQMQKARKLYETLVQDTAVGNIQAQLAFIAFEMRMQNNEKVKDLFFKALEKALSKQDTRTVCLLSMKYARFLAFKCNDVQRACEVMDRALSQS